MSEEAINEIGDVIGNKTNRVIFDFLASNPFYTTINDIKNYINSPESEMLDGYQIKDVEPAILNLKQRKLIRFSLEYNGYIITDKGLEYYDMFKEQAKATRELRQSLEKR